MKTSREAYFRQCFVLNEEELKKLYRSLEDFGGDIQIEIKCKDGLNRHMTKLEELLEFENPPKKEIQAMILSSQVKDSSHSARFGFLNSEESNVTIHIEGPDEHVVKLNSAIEERLSSIKPYYAFFARLDFLKVAIMLFFGYILILVVLRGVGIIHNLNDYFIIEPEPNADSETKVLFFITSLLLFTAPFTAGFILNHLRKSLFPIGVFAIGQGQKRHSQNEWLRTAIITAFFISLAAGVLLLLFT